MFNRNDPMDPAVIENRTTFLTAHSINIMKTTRAAVSFDRSDFCRYKAVTSENKGDGMINDIGEVLDAIITTDSNHALFLAVADCVGMTVFDETHHVLALAHLGRHNLEQDGGKKIIAHLTERYGSDPATLKIWLTPAPGKDVYPIWALDNKGMKEVTYEQLLGRGILKENITDNTVETNRDDNYFSYSEFLKGNRPEDGDHAMVAMMTD